MGGAQSNCFVKWAVAKIVLMNWQQNISISLIIFLRRSRGMNMKWNESDWDQCFMTYVSLFLSKSYNASERPINYIAMTNDLAESGVFVQIKCIIPYLRERATTR